MPKVTDEMIQTYIDRSRHNELDMLRSDKCCCYFCGEVFSAREVVDWASEGGDSFALCPSCCFPSVIGDAYVGKITPALAGRIHDYYKANPNSAPNANWMPTYCDLFIKGKINSSPITATIFTMYAMGSTLTTGDNSFLLTACRYVAYGQNGVRQDPDTAIKMLTSETFQNDLDAMILLGDIYFDHLGKEKATTQDKKAFQYYSFATNLGSLEARVKLYHCYLGGIGVKANRETALAVLDAFHDEAVMSTFGNSIHEDYELFNYFREYALTLADCGENEAQKREFVRSLLVARYYAFLIDGDENGKNYLLIERALQDAKRDLGLEKMELALDEQSFYDTFVELGAYSLISIPIENASFDRASNELRITLAPLSSFLLLDTAAFESSLVHRERITFVFHYVVDVSFPEGPFSFCWVSTPEGDANCWQLKDGDDIVASIHFDPSLFEEGGE